MKVQFGFFSRLIKLMIIDVFIGTLVYGSGYATLKILTTGKYPKANSENKFLCEITGAVALVITICFVAYFNQY